MPNTTLIAVSKSTSLTESAIKILTNTTRLITKSYTSIYSIARSSASYMCIISL